MEQPFIIRHAKPTKYDLAPQGTMCKVVQALSREYFIYKQISSDEESPCWELIGTFTENNSTSI